MGRFFTRFSDLLTPGERERMADLQRKGIPQNVRDIINIHTKEYWKNFELANYIAGYICVSETFERQQEVTALLESNQKKSRRKKMLFGVVVILLCCGALAAAGRMIWWVVVQLF